MSPMTLQILSDLHFEAGDTPVSVEDLVGDIVVLAGDIDSNSVRLAKRLVEWRRFSGKQIVLVPGNHEFDGNIWETLTEELRQLVTATQTDGIHVLNGDCLRIGQVSILGTTLWTGFSGERDLSHYRELPTYTSCMRMNGDSLTPQDTKRFHKDAVSWLKHKISEETRIGRECVVVTHHAPSWRSISPSMRHHPLNSAYATDMDSLIMSAAPILWVHGHTHVSNDYTIGATRVVSNPYGYGSDDGTPENAAWRKQFCVEI